MIDSLGRRLAVQILLRAKHVVSLAAGVDAEEERPAVVGDEAGAVHPGPRAHLRDEAAIHPQLHVADDAALRVERLEVGRVHGVLRPLRCELTKKLLSQLLFQTPLCEQCSLQCEILQNSVYKPLYIPIGDLSFMNQDIRRLLPFLLPPGRVVPLIVIPYVCLNYTHTNQFG